MSNKLFDEQMTSSEARMAFYRAIEGKSAEEMESIKAEYFRISDIILKRELELASRGWFVD